jgi:hypothetical protein
MRFESIPNPNADAASGRIAPHAAETVVSRGDWIRTSDLPAPSRMRYQTAPRPVVRASLRQVGPTCMGTCVRDGCGRRIQVQSVQRNQGCDGIHDARLIRWPPRRRSEAIRRAGSWRAVLIGLIGDDEGAGDGSRTRAESLEGSSAAVTPHPPVRASVDRTRLSTDKGPGEPGPPPCL